jgi:PrtD family type I secretion system ABC transporter
LNIPYPAIRILRRGQRSELTSILLSYRRIFYIVGFYTAVINFILIVPALYMFQVYDSVLSSRSTETLIMLSLIALFMYFVFSFLNWSRSQILIRLSNDIDKKLSDRTFMAVLSGILKTGTISPSQVFGDLTNLRQFVTGSGVFAFFDAPWAFIYLVVIFIIHPVLGLFSLIVGIIQVIGAYASEKLTRDPIKSANRFHNEATNFLQANLRNAEVIEAMGMHTNVMKKWREKYEKVLLLQSQASHNAAKMESTIRFLRIAAQSMILGTGAYYVIQNHITPGMMIMASILMGRALSPIDTAVAVWKQFVSARDSYERLKNLLDAYPPQERHLSLPEPKGHLRIENCTVGPPGTQFVVLRYINFEVTPGEAVAIIGPTASGKSTLAKLIVGVWPPYFGAVRLDGADISFYNKDELGRFIGYLPQDIELFSGTIAENIARFGEINMDQVIKAAKMAGIHEMILQFSKGYETEIGELGGSLSGGQKQRIGLARALYGDPVLVVLDEPNSNLDEVGEQALMRALLILKSMKRTILVISHRTNILSVVDKIMVLGGGQIQLFGPTSEVLQILRKRTEELARKAKGESVE